MRQYLAGKLLERATSPVQSDMGEITLTIDHTLTRSTTVTMAGLQALADL
ncbi:MAG: hypothetical protein GX791_00060 [Synergistaceae bacterium]|nr:hypothetical protein [Synergistaceae bacterium]